MKVHLAQISPDRYNSRSCLAASKSSISAHVAELVDAHGSGPCAARCGGSSPSVGTIYRIQEKAADFHESAAFFMARSPPAASPQINRKTLLTDTDASIKMRASVAAHAATVSSKQ